MENEYETLKKNKSQNEDTWREDGRWKTDPWKDWKGRDETTKEDNNNNWKWEKKPQTNVKDERGTRVWWGGRIDRRNEMVARSFKRILEGDQIKGGGESMGCPG